jgi:hypothetical protein
MLFFTTNSMSESIECPICYTCIDNNAVSSYKYGCITNCRHHFHSHCLYKWTYIENQDDCPYCRTLLDHNLLDYQYALRKMLRMKERQPTNEKIDDLLERLGKDRIRTLDGFCSSNKAKMPFYAVHKPARSRIHCFIPNTSNKKILYQRPYISKRNRR